jgi:hypothetical protein
MASTKRASTHHRTSSRACLPNQSPLGVYHANYYQRDQIADASHCVNIIELILRDDKLKFEFPRLPRSTIESTKRSNADGLSGSDVESLYLDDARSATSQDSSEEITKGHGSTPTEDQQEGRRGIPIPGHGQSVRRTGTWEDEMDDEKVLEELAASEGGFNRSWQHSHQGR